MNCLIWHKKHDIVTQRVHTKIHFTKLLFTGEEFMVLENIIGEKFMIPWKNIHPCYCCLGPLRNKIHKALPLLFTYLYVSVLDSVIKGFISSWKCLELETTSARRNRGI